MREHAFSFPMRAPHGAWVVQPASAVTLGAPRSTSPRARCSRWSRRRSCCSTVRASLGAAAWLRRTISGGTHRTRNCADPSPKTEYMCSYGVPWILSAGGQVSSSGSHGTSATPASRHCRTSVIFEGSTSSSLQCWREVLPNSALARLHVGSRRNGTPPSAPAARPRRRPRRCRALNTRTARCSSSTVASCALGAIWSARRCSSWMEHSALSHPISRIKRLRSFSVLYGRSSLWHVPASWTRDGGGSSWPKRGGAKSSIITFLLLTHPPTKMWPGGAGRRRPPPGVVTYAIFCSHCVWPCVQRRCAYHVRQRQHSYVGMPSKTLSNFPR